MTKTDPVSEMGHSIMVFVENTFTILQWVAGALLIYLWSPLAAIIFLIWAVFSLVWFWRTICIHCPNVRTGHCPSGYNVIVRRWFGYKDPRGFKAAFYRNIAVILPWWIAPLIVGGYLLIHNGMDMRVVLLLAIVVVVGFVLVPVVSKKVGCRYCSNRNNCPWKD